MKLVIYLVVKCVTGDSTVRQDPVVTSVSQPGVPRDDAGTTPPVGDGEKVQVQDSGGHRQTQVNVYWISLQSEVSLSSILCVVCLLFSV